MTQQQIDKIHADRTAKPGKTYVGPRGEFYSGSKTGHLTQEQTMNGDVVGTTLRSVVSKIGEYTVEEITEILISISDLLTKKEFEEYKKTAATKCFAVAMAITL